MAGNADIDYAVIEEDFFRFLQTAKVAQSLLLLRNVTTSQVEAISEICFNISGGSEVVENQELLTDLKQFKHVIRKLSDNDLRIAERRSVINRHPQIVLKIIQKAESILPW
jgi:hypothetical protein